MAIEKALQVRINQLWTYQRRDILHLIAGGMALKDAVRTVEDAWTRYRERLTGEAPPAGDAR